VQERVLLATLVNHPGLFASVEEEVGLMEMIDPAHDSLRQALLAALSGDGSLDAASLRNHLEGQGFTGLLTGLLSAEVYTHAAFAKPGQNLEKALEGWRETCKFLQQKTAWKEIRAAGADLARDFSDEKERKIMALHDLHRAADE
jgi:DNA primase